MCSFRSYRSKESPLTHDCLGAAKVEFAETLRRESLNFMFMYFVLTAFVHFALLAVAVVSVRDHQDSTYSKNARRIFAFFVLVMLRGVLSWKSSVCCEGRCHLGRCLFCVNTAIEATIFVATGALRGISEGSAVVANFYTSICLSYMILLVLPLRCSAIVAPLCLLSYVAGTLGPEGSFGLSFLDLGLLIGGMCLNIVSRVVWERSRWETFLTLRERTREAIHEKVLRCQAEFAHEVSNRNVFCGSCKGNDANMDSEYLHSRSGEVADAASESAIAAAKTVPAAPSPPVSLRSAPAVLQSDVKGGVWDNTGPCGQADCLLPDSMVWVEGNALPELVERVLPGQRVLCYDRLGGHLKHAVVVEATRREASAPTEWVRVSLSDGTSMEMTADHFVTPVGPAVGHGRPAGPFGGAACTKAAKELQASVDRLLVLKLVPVEVSEVDVFVEARPRVFLTVQQPERHAIFVAGAVSDKTDEVGCRPMLQPIAVESANRGDHGAVTFDARRTFLQVLDESMHREGNRDVRRRRHPKSAPSVVGASFAGDDVSGTATAALHLDEETHQQENVQHSFASQTRLPQEAGTVADEPWSDVSSNSSCDASFHDSGDDLEVVLVGPRPSCDFDEMSVEAKQTDTDSRATGHPFASTGSCVSLSDLLAVRRAGLASFGGHNHANGSCVMCIFENRAQHFGGRPCFKGALCERCHETHLPFRVAQRQRRKTRRTLRQLVFDHIKIECH
eukprot:TRINITY_DN11651_c0_g1_i3.p1 TRINITY_DN11651_c0_g1~~TRINITY_DN11651_c0_g1_i3.p1  ORF type:complete len:733 (-),score=97.16 TRINITY_DN11651_c0_g1_i3:227-2425(-)